MHAYHEFVHRKGEGGRLCSIMTFMLWEDVIVFGKGDHELGDIFTVTVMKR